ncbi:hypothetical protein [Algoriphagus limi]|uniref:DUF5034 domain-containing protein n=1 Tax=Algoriphagus limi TaxID=2975273 RepID=A0ABT2G5Y4_9BACT|nr:hypothetical protein [Algoriphagus limi]MCS5489337.1 hypothetical protein [Algoriphagus limi]
MKKFFLTSSLFFFLGLIPMACNDFCGNPCGCGPIFDVSDFRVQSFETISLTTEGQQVSPTISLPYNFITKSFRIKEIVTLSERKNSNSSTWGMALACSPPSPQSQEKMIGIQIINSREVELGDGEILKVGQDLTSYFEMNNFFSEQTKPIPEFFNTPVPLFMEDLFKLVWIKDPQKEVQLEFSIRILMENGLDFNLSNEILSIRSQS